MTLLATLGALIVFLWARDMFGYGSGLFALGLFAFSPNLLAHGMLVTTDVPLAVFMTLAMYLLWKFRPGISAVAVGFATGAAMASKFSGAILPLIIIAFCAWRALSASDKRGQALVEMKFLAIAGMSALLVVEASYLFSTVPWTYITNMRSVNANHNPNHHFYVLGNFSLAGWWYYFPLAFVFKATIPLLLTIVMAAIHTGAKRFLDLRGEMLLLTGVVSYTAAVMMGADDIGVRYLLPVFPLLFIWGSRIVVEFQTRKAGIALLAFLVLWQARAGLAAFPNYIPYFNEIAGGAASGVHYLDDSNVDWGQGMKQAADYVRSHHLESVELLPFSPFDNPRYYGIKRPHREDLDTYRMTISGPPHPGTYIVSAHHLTRMMYIRPEWNPRNAVDRIGDSLWVFRF
jgi:4-amino-4-deoxy-L-arabinose transferase-like glycosyltransferase